MKAQQEQYRGLRIRITDMTNTECADLTWVGYNKYLGDRIRRVDYNSFNLWTLYKAGAIFSAELSQEFKKMFANTLSKPLQISTNLPLRKYQKKGVSSLFTKQGNALLADEPGLGKTCQSIAYLMVARIKRVIIVCPAHLKLNWQEEFAKFWTDEHVEVIFGRTVYQIPSSKTIIIINRQILDNWIEELLATDPQQLIIDEAHECCNPRSGYYTNVLRLDQHTKKTILITGTPLLNKSKDLWVLASIINIRVLGVYTAFLNRFCPEEAYATKQSYGKPKFGKKIWLKEKKVKDNTENLILLNTMLRRTFMIRRLKSEVAKELPKKIRQIIHVKLKNSAVMRAEKKIKEREEKLNPDITITKSMLDRYSVIRMQLGLAKVKTAVEFIKNFLIENPNKKIVVVGWHILVTEELHKAFKKQSYLINGKATPTAQKKHAIIKAFSQPDTLTILVANIKSIETGLNIPIADYLLVVELPYTGASLSQLEDRLHRLGKIAKMVMYYYMIIQGTLEDKIFDNIIKKQKDMNRAIDGMAGATLEDAEIVR